MLMTMIVMRVLVLLVMIFFHSVSSHITIIYSHLIEQSTIGGGVGAASLKDKLQMLSAVVRCDRTQQRYSNEANRVQYHPYHQPILCSIHTINPPYVAATL